MNTSSKTRATTRGRMGKDNAKGKRNAPDAARMDASVAARLSAVSAARTATAPNKPVKIALLEGERLNAAVGKYEKVLKALPGFRGEDLTLLPALLKALESAEQSWLRLRASQGSASLVAFRRDAEAWRRTAMAAARYLLRRDPQAMLEVGRIAEGDSLADLVQDLDDLGALVREHARSFAALSPPIDVAYAKRLASALRKGRDGERSAAALAHRNRAFWALEDALDEIRAALRFVLRDEPKKLAPLLSRYEADRRAKRRRAARAAAVTNGASAGSPAQA